MPEDNGNSVYDAALNFETLERIRERLFGETPRPRPVTDAGQPRPPRALIESERILAALAERPLPPDSMPDPSLAERRPLDFRRSSPVAPPAPLIKRKRASPPYTQKKIKQIAQVIRASLVPVSFNEEFIRVQFDVFLCVVQQFADYLCQQNHYRFNVAQFEQLCGMPTMNKMWKRAHHAPSALTRERPLP
jgi:hypothetical protein